MAEGNQEQNKKERRFSQEQYKMLKRCSDKKDITEWNEWRENNKEVDVFLEGAFFSKAYLKGSNLFRAKLKDASFINANLEGADLRLSDLENVDFFGANLRSAELTYSNMKSVKLSTTHLEGAEIWSANLENTCIGSAHLENTNFSHSYLKGTCFGESYLQDSDFELAIVDGETSIWKCEVNRYTNFSGVGLDSVRIDAATKQLLKYNIRRMNWEKWYSEHPQLKWLVKPFWLMSDYGLSTSRIIFTFFGLAFVFANIYYHWGRLAPPGIVNYLFVDRNGIEVQWWLVPLRTLYFSIVTMTTLGFGDMYANAHSVWGHIMLSLQVILGYVLLAALVTRFAVLFMAGGPAGKFAEEKKVKNPQPAKPTAAGE